MNAAYRGPLKAVIFDWAGTTVDFGCQAPAVVLQELFARHEVPITCEEARRDMGLRKKDHIRSILAQPRVADSWATRHGRPDEATVDRLYAEFVPRQVERLAEFSDVIPGVTRAVDMLRRRGMRIGSTTGYTRPMLDAILQQAAAQDYRPDSSVTPDEAGEGRPAPWMCFLNLARLQVFPPEACVKIGDTPADIQEGLNAGMWTVAVVDSSNEIGLTRDAWEALDEPGKEAHRSAAREKLWLAGADYVIDSLDALERVLDEIERSAKEARRS